MPRHAIFWAINVSVMSWTHAPQEKFEKAALDMAQAEQTAEAALYCKRAAGPLHSTNLQGGYGSNPGVTWLLYIMATSCRCACTWIRFEGICLSSHHSDPSCAWQRGPEHYNWWRQIGWVLGIRGWVERPDLCIRCRHHLRNRLWAPSRYPNMTRSQSTRVQGRPKVDQGWMKASPRMNKRSPIASRRVLAMFHGTPECVQKRSMQWKHPDQSQLLPSTGQTSWLLDRKAWVHQRDLVLAQEVLFLGCHICHEYQNSVIQFWRKAWSIWPRLFWRPMSLGRQNWFLTLVALAGKIQ